MNLKKQNENEQVFPTHFCKSNNADFYSIHVRTSEMHFKTDNDMVLIQCS